MSGPSALNVLYAMKQATWKRTVFIADRVRRMSAFPNVRTDFVLRRLRALESAGHVKCDGYKQGYYGFGWEITPSGEALLAERS